MIRAEADSSVFGTSVGQSLQMSVKTVVSLGPPVQVG
jgi:hypothetical protein